MGDARSDPNARTHDPDRRTPSSSTILPSAGNPSDDSTASLEAELSTPQGSINGDAEDDDGGGKTPRPHDAAPSSSASTPSGGGGRSIFWGLAGIPLVGSSSGAEKKPSSETAAAAAAADLEATRPKGRRGTLIARAFGGKGKEKERERESNGKPWPPSTAEGQTAVVHGAANGTT